MVSKMKNEEIQKVLSAPFPYEDIEWRVQNTTKDKLRGMAVVYITSRAIQKRLDDAVGPYNWKTEYKPWHMIDGNPSQICGLSIFDEAKKEWITKWDGAENTDFESVKGGISDAFKRAAVLWGIGRYLYSIDSIWVEIEPSGKSYKIKESEQTKATKNAEYEAIKAIYKQNNVTGLDEKIRKAEEEIQAKNQLVYAALEYTGKRAELTFSKLVTANVRIVLYKVLKTTSEVKNVFQFTYKNRSYKRLSHSEKLLAGVETAELIKRLTGRNYPMFIDDAESIDSIPKPSGQALLALVRPKTPLTVKSQSKNPPLAKAS